MDEEEQGLTLEGIGKERAGHNAYLRGQQASYALDRMHAATPIDPHHPDETLPSGSLLDIRESAAPAGAQQLTASHPAAIGSPPNDHGVGAQAEELRRRSPDWASITTGGGGGKGTVSGIK